MAENSNFNCFKRAFLWRVLLNCYFNCFKEYHHVEISLADVRAHPAVIHILRELCTEKCRVPPLSTSACQSRFPKRASMCVHVFLDAVVSRLQLTTMIAVSHPWAESMVSVCEWCMLSLWKHVHVGIAVATLLLHGGTESPLQLPSPPLLLITELWVWLTLWET